MAFTLLLWLLPTFGYKQPVILYIISILAQIGMSAVETVLAAIMMDKSSLANASTDFTVQTSVMYFSGILAMGISGKVAEVFSYRELFLISTILTLIAVVVAAKLYDEKSSHLEHLSNLEKIKT
jgi:MFS family permease